MRNRFPSRWQAYVLLLLPQLIWTGLFLGGTQIAHENGPMENLQVAFLAAGAALLAWSAFIATAVEPQLLLAGLTMFYVNFAIREVEIGTGQAPEWIVYLLNDRPRDVWITAVWAVLFVLFLRRGRGVLQYFLIWIKSTPGRLLVAAGVAYGLSSLFDNALVVLPAEQSSFVEELADSVATTLMLLAAVFVFRDRRQTVTTGSLPLPLPAQPRD